MPRGISPSCIPPSCIGSSHVPVTALRWSVPPGSPRATERAALCPSYRWATEARPAGVSLFLAWVGDGGSPHHLALRGTGVSLGQVDRASPSDPRPREGHPRCYFWLLQVGPGLLPPQLPRLGGLRDLTGCQASSWPRGNGGRGRAPHTQALTPFSTGWGELGEIPRPGLTALCSEQLSITPCPGFQSSSWFPSPVGGCKNSTWFELGAGGGGGLVSLLLEELPAHMLPGALAGRGKRGSKPASGRRRRWKLDPPRLSRLFDLF